MLKSGEPTKREKREADKDGRKERRSKRKEKASGRVEGTPRFSSR